jgi:hypothetical protein
MLELAGLLRASSLTYFTDVETKAQGEYLDNNQNVSYGGGLSCSSLESNSAPPCSSLMLTTKLRDPNHQLKNMTVSFMPSPLRNRMSISFDESKCPFLLLCI